uniref:Uncharacterized protein n=1 Tax=Candidatus Kentrum sp. DK TaxID=2126562 RepID=A0A450T5D2_9GAMM|nr:MAG: hypothetical protein BECKDK2373C_GA0170839_10012 [Candidatus Kentron sp. DK]VFJ61882.1 MAG: hypothetical protein BECKDK2373B_GA0170837_11054 [Candidatus Kentron sp. DK]
MTELATNGHDIGISVMHEFPMRVFARATDFDKTSILEPFYQLSYLFRQVLYPLLEKHCNYLPYEPVIGLSGRARLLPSRKYREIKLGGSLALPDKW